MYALLDLASQHTSALYTDHRRGLMNERFHFETTKSYTFKWTWPRLKEFSRLSVESIIPTYF